MTKPNKTLTLRTWTDEQLATERDRLRDELYHFRYKMRVEEVENPNAKETLKRNIARVMTVLRERELAGKTAYAVKVEKADALKKANAAKKAEALKAKALKAEAKGQAAQTAGAQAASAPST